MSPIILIGAGILLLGLGAGLGYWLALSLRKREETKVADVQKELDDYRRHVTEHFADTAQHFKALGQQYQSLYKHMAHGAEALCDPAQSDAMLEFPAGDTAAIAASAEQPEAAPESIKDYAPTKEQEIASEESKAKKADIVEPMVKNRTADAKISDDKPTAEIEDAIEKTAADDAERTVH